MPTIGKHWCPRLQIESSPGGIPCHLKQLTSSNVAAPFGNIPSFFKLSTQSTSTINANILGRVEVRLGEGPFIEIRRGLVEITFSPGDAVFAWSEGSWREEAAMPFANFCRYVSDGAIDLVGP